MPETQIYHYRSSRQFLLDQVNRLQNSGKGDSIRTVASRMKISHTLLVMLLQGKRPIRVKHASAFAQGFRLDSQERLYLQALIQLENARDAEEKQLCQLWLSELHPATQTNTRVFDQFELISNWIHMAILSMCELRDFDPSPEAIAQRLGDRVTAHEVRAAVERLASQGLLQITKEGRLLPTQAQVTTSDDVLSHGARKYHKQVMALAQEALDHVPLDRREYHSFAIAVPRDRIPLAKDLIRKFRAQFVKAMDSAALDEVYQMNIQLFQLTESPARPVRIEDEGVDHHPKSKMAKAKLNNEMEKSYVKSH